MGISNRWIHCAECGRNRRHLAKELCGRCYDRQYREANPDRVRESNRQYREAHREELAAYSCQWRKANPDKHYEAQRRRRARKKGATISPVNEAAIYERDGRACLYCGASEDLTLDHIVALNSGGAHCEDNLAVACRPCNCSKRDTSLEDWLQTQPRALAWVA